MAIIVSMKQRSPPLSSLLVVLAVLLGRVALVLSSSPFDTTDGPREEVLSLSSLLDATHSNSGSDPRWIHQNGNCRLRIKKGGDLIVKRWIPEKERYVRSWQTNGPLREWIKGVLSSTMGMNKTSFPSSVKPESEHHHHKNSAEEPMKKKKRLPDPVRIPKKTNITLQSTRPPQPRDPTLTIDRDCRLSLYHSKKSSTNDKDGKPDLMWRNIQDIESVSPASGMSAAPNSASVLRQGDMLTGYDEHCHGACNQTRAMDDSNFYCIKTRFTLELQARDCRLVQYVGMDRADYVVQRQLVWSTPTLFPRVHSPTCELRLKWDEIVLLYENKVWRLVNVSEACPACHDDGYGARLSTHGGLVLYAIS